jgi:prophage regulatory protein
MAEVTRLTGLSKSQIYLLENRGEFPRRVHLGPQSSAYSSEEIGQWIEKRLAARNGEAEARRGISARLAEGRRKKQLVASS